MLATRSVDEQQAASVAAWTAELLAHAAALKLRCSVAEMFMKNASEGRGQRRHGGWQDWHVHDADHAGAPLRISIGCL